MLLNKLCSAALHLSRKRLCLCNKPYPILLYLKDWSYEYIAVQNVEQCANLMHFTPHYCQYSISCEMQSYICETSNILYPSDIVFESQLCFCIPTIKISSVKNCFVSLQRKFLDWKVVWYPYKRVFKTRKLICRPTKCFVKNNFIVVSI